MDRILLKDISLNSERSDIFIEEGKISRIAPAGTICPPEGCDVMDCRRKAAVPGFVNMHTHAAMSLMRGIGEDMVLTDWLDHIWEIESSLTDRFVHLGTEVAALEMIKTGTTMFNDQYWFPLHGHSAAAEMGLRSVVSYVVCDKNNPEAVRTRYSPPYRSTIGRT